MKLCPNCRTQNDDDAKFCKECATPFTANAAGYAAAQEAVKEKAPLDELIGRFKKTSVASESQPSLWQKTKGWVRSNYYVLFFIVMIVLVFVVLIIGVNSAKNTLPTASSTSSDLSSYETEPSKIYTVSESDIIEVDYTYLVDNSEKYESTDKYIRVAGQIHGVYVSYLHALSFKTPDGKELVVYVQAGCDLKEYKKDMYVTLVCRFKSSTSNSVNMHIGYIEESGEAAEQTYNRLKAAGDKQRAADKKAEQEKAKKEKKDYIASCKTYKYKDIARNPDKYYGKRAKFKGEVVQVIEGYLDITLRVDVTKGKYGIYTDTMYVVYTPQSTTENRILEDDIITIYGELAGIETYETVMGAKVSIPRIDAEYITINSK